jgi:hypothetical protein
METIRNISLSDQSGLGYGPPHNDNAVRVDSSAGQRRSRRGMPIVGMRSPVPLEPAMTAFQDSKQGSSRRIFAARSSRLLPGSARISQPIRFTGC